MLNFELKFKPKVKYLPSVCVDYVSVNALRNVENEDKSVVKAR